MAKIISWDLKCPNCGFEFGITTDFDEPEAIKKELRSCPCGSDVEIKKEYVYEETPQETLKRMSKGE